MANSLYVVDVTLENFQSIVLEGSQQRAVLVDFWADWCAPCRALSPLLDSIAEQMDGQLLVAKVNTEQQQELAAQFAIRSLPTVKLFQQGQLVDEFMGALPEQEIKNFLAKHLARPSDAQLTQAQQLLTAGQRQTALELVQQARAADPDNPRGLFILAQCQTAAEDFDAAENTLNSLPLDQQDKTEVQALRAQLQFAKVAASAASRDALQQRLAADPNDSEARYQLATRLVLEKDYPAALEALLTLLRKDRRYGDDAARKGILQVFALLGGSGELVNRYRSKMTNALF